MNQMEWWLSIFQICAPIAIALIGIIPTIIANRKKTQDSIDEMKGQVTKELESTKKEITDLQTGFEAHVAEEEEHRAKQARYRFLRFYDELCEGRVHSESHFEDVLEDCDMYENYCEHHPDFKNSRGKAAIDYIRKTYERLKSSGKFLTHKEGE